MRLRLLSDLANPMQSLRQTLQRLRVLLAMRHAGACSKSWLYQRAFQQNVIEIKVPELAAGVIKKGREGRRGSSVSLRTFIRKLIRLHNTCKDFKSRTPRTKDERPKP